MNLPTSIINRQQAIPRLLNGEVGVLPTDTIYGLVARAEDAQAVARLYSLKNRQAKPGTLVAASIDDINQVALPAATHQAEHYWPNPISIILPVKPQFAYLHQGIGTLAMRIPSDPTFQSLLAKTGALQTTSANHPGKPSATTLQEAIDYFGDSVDFYVDGGDLSGRPPSTVARITPSGTLEILRAGAFYPPSHQAH